MAVVLLKIFEEANLSGELKLSGRKLRDFPKVAAKYNLSDTVIAGTCISLSFMSCTYTKYYALWLTIMRHIKWTSSSACRTMTSNIR